MGLSSYGLKDEFKTAVLNEPSVFEPLKFYCIAGVQGAICGDLPENFSRGAGHNTRIAEKKVKIPAIARPLGSRSFNLLVHKTLNICGINISRSM